MSSGPSMPSATKATAAPGSTGPGSTPCGTPSATPRSISSRCSALTASRASMPIRPWSSRSSAVPAATVAFLNHTISDNPGDQLLLQIQGAVAEYERALLGERFRRGKLQKARAGWFIGGRAPYGYRYIPCRDGAGGRLEVDEDEAAFVRMLYGWLVEERMTIRQILKRLNFGPWYPRSGKHPWSPSVVHHILSEPVYTGTTYTNRYDLRRGQEAALAQAELARARDCRRIRPREQWIAIPVPPIIEPDLWDRAQAQLARNAQLSFRNNQKHNHLLRCLLTCGACGLAMHGVARTLAGGVAAQHYYRCAGKDRVMTAREIACPRAQLDGERLETAVWEHISTLAHGSRAAAGAVRALRRRCRPGWTARAGSRAAHRGPSRPTGPCRAAPRRCLSGRGDQPGRAERATPLADRAAPRPRAAAGYQREATPRAVKGAGRAGSISPPFATGSAAGSRR